MKHSLKILFTSLLFFIPLTSLWAYDEGKTQELVDIVDELFMFSEVPENYSEYIRRVETLFEEGADPNCLDFFDDYAVFSIFESEEYWGIECEITSLFVKNGFNLDVHSTFSGDTLPVSAIKTGYIDLLTEILNLGIIVADEEIMNFAIERSDQDIINLLLDYGGILSHNQDLEIALMQNQMEAIQPLLREAPEMMHNVFSSGFTPLTRATGNISAEIVQLLLEQGADPNQTDGNGNTPLISLLSNPGEYVEELFNLLIEYGADLLQADGEGTTPLQAAMQGGKPSLIGRILLMDHRYETDAAYRQELFNTNRLYSKDLELAKLFYQDSMEKSSVAYEYMLDDYPALARFLYENGFPSSEGGLSSDFLDLYFQGMDLFGMDFQVYYSDHFFTDFETFKAEGDYLLLGSKYGGLREYLLWAQNPVIEERIESCPDLGYLEDFSINSTEEVILLDNERCFWKPLGSEEDWSHFELGRGLSVYDDPENSLVLGSYDGIYVFDYSLLEWRLIDLDTLWHLPEYEDSESGRQRAYLDAVQKALFPGFNRIRADGEHYFLSSSTDGLYIMNKSCTQWNQYLDDPGSRNFAVSGDTIVSHGAFFPDVNAEDPEIVHQVHYSVNGGTSWRELRHSRYLSGKEILDVGIVGTRLLIVTEEGLAAYHMGNRSWRFFSLEGITALETEGNRIALYANQHLLLFSVANNLGSDSSDSSPVDIYGDWDNLLYPDLDLHIGVQEFVMGEVSLLDSAESSRVYIEENGREIFQNIRAAERNRSIYQINLYDYFTSFAEGNEYLIVARNDVMDDFCLSGQENHLLRLIDHADRVAALESGDLNIWIFTKYPELYPPGEEYDDRLFNLINEYLFEDVVGIELNDSNREVLTSLLIYQRERP